MTHICCCYPKTRSPLGLVACTTYSKTVLQSNFTVKQIIFDSYYRSVVETGILGTLTQEWRFCLECLEVTMLEVFTLNEGETAALTFGNQDSDNINTTPVSSTNQCCRAHGILYIQSSPMITKHLLSTKSEILLWCLIHPDNCRGV